MSKLLGGWLLALGALAAPPPTQAVVNQDLPRPLAVSGEDLHRFPAPRECVQELDFNLVYCQALLTQLQATLNPRVRLRLETALAEAQRRRAIWNMLWSGSSRLWIYEHGARPGDEVFLEGYCGQYEQVPSQEDYLGMATYWAGSLRDALGEPAYLAGALPPCVPVECFVSLDE